MTTPPLIALAEGRRARPRQAPRVDPSELDLHLAVAGLLRRFLRSDWRWTHVASGEHRDVRTAAKLKAMGVQRGWPDIVLLSPDRGMLHSLELKRAGGRLSPDQQAFRHWCIVHGAPYCMASSMAEVLTALTAWRCLASEVRL